MPVGLCMERGSSGSRRATIFSQMSMEACMEFVKPGMPAATSSNACSLLVHWTCLMVVVLRRTTLSCNGIEGCSGSHLSPCSNFLNPFSALRQDNIQNQNLIGSKRHHNNAAQYCPQHNLYTLEHFLGKIHRDSTYLTIIPLVEGLRESYFPFFFLNLRVFIKE